ncbi:glutamine--fructose-6-phosphate transaminase (isomerizing) [Holzapfeliella floricola]|uniref:Glutamine--fructose-6-phosphate aminotransferase [isomerizing] n=1 Tax=Holzapfeliella floricola DSM 23037 = JCM 16512 TaxID=1423744 RepID=A0A0R2DHD6_9LACO|nr:glutamine--fructose-6-phosphate transaminase (isomerizing) [Holzapfeliella floricola]KRN03521.1 glucosamine--fructose-6-phosphate aminotransferase [Holzapfeliella floricola DSM 23037 = JCM 16512]
MCGIVGVVGNENATDILVNGLTKLEYRGYDSAGIYVNNQNNQDFLVKATGKIKELKNKITPEVKGSIGIGHTRWATHGIPTIENAHPHLSNDDRFYLVHNGVINNYQELRDDYLADVKFHSQTDTEVVVQLVDRFVVDEGLDTFTAFQKVLHLIDGSYAFLLVDRQNPETLYVAKRKSPLLLGLAQGFNVVTSDAMAMLDQTKDFVELNDGEVVILTQDDYQIFNENNQEVKRDSYHLSVDSEAASKGTYPHFMLKEIDEQPSVMRRISQEYFSSKGEVEVDENIVNSILDSDRIYIVAAGTSYHAGLVGQKIIEKLAGIPVEVHVASEFGYYPPILSRKPFFIFLSQSGETADSRQVLSEVNKKGHPSLTITNVDRSTLSREATYTMLLHAGPEISVASTKAYTAQIAVQAVLAKALSEKSNYESGKQFDLQTQLALVANGMQEIVDEKQLLDDMSRRILTDADNAFYIGRGIDYNVALEAALKLKEISYIHTEGFAAGELKHGTIALIEEGTPVIGFITDKLSAGHTRSNLQEVLSRGAEVFTISMKRVANENDGIILPDVDTLLTPLLSVIPAQLIAYYTSLNRGHDVDQPRNLAKSVTVE